MTFVSCAESESSCDGVTAGTALPTHIFAGTPSHRHTEDPVMANSPVAPASAAKLDAFLDHLAAHTSNHGRIVFALDATASRQPTWDPARFDSGAADQLRELLKAVAIFATGGTKALEGKPGATRLLLEQLK